ncbi:MAG: polyprenyl synthetase family protein [Lachnospiraceae bacterium]|jgi:geranylgeranyl diphosphate synthase type II|nr:polyprenyl synthetase family protein [Lachnospiraceae bacterium]
MNFKEELERRIREIENIIQAYLPREKGFQKTVIEAMNYSILAGGKRLRPLFMKETYDMMGGGGKEIEPFLAAMEMVHTYSLIHDDLPAMDNDEYRRGRKTTHVMYGEAMAILAGDGLLNLAFETAAKAFQMGDDPARVGRALALFAGKAGIYGMIGGQTADIEAEEKGGITEELLLFIHENKTAALIQSAMMTGAILAGASDRDVDRLEKIGYNIGVAFQIQDDILDVTGKTEILGKPVGSDEKNNKITYVTIKGLKQAQADQRALSEEAIALLGSFGRRNLFLEKLVEDLVTRNK